MGEIPQDALPTKVIGRWSQVSGIAIHPEGAVLPTPDEEKENPE